MMQYCTFLSDEAKLARLDPNFELLAATNGFPFILPGNIGMGWYDTETTAKTPYQFIMSEIDGEVWVFPYGGYIY